MVGDHPLHETHIGFGELNASEIGSFLRGEQPTRLAGRARLHDRRRRLALHCGERREHREGQDAAMGRPQRPRHYRTGLY